MSTEITETKCPFMQNGGFICIKRKCALYAEDKCSISYLPNIAKEKQEKENNEELPVKVFNAIDWLNNEQGAVKGNIKALFDNQMNYQEVNNKNIAGLKEAVVGIQTLTQQVNALKTKGETLEKTLATLKKEFAEVEKQVKRKK